MQLNYLKPTYSKKNKKRVGRGGKRGTYSGRGQKGQRARAGRRLKPALRELIYRLPKLRGVKNKPLKPKPKIFQVGELEKIFNRELIDKKAFLESGLIKNRSEVVKILGGGTVSKALTVKGLSLSKSAIKKIETAGGKVIIDSK
jgi:large subunit ribosomal protein L15